MGWPKHLVFQREPHQNSFSNTPLNQTERILLPTATAVCPRDSAVSLWICLRHLTNLHALMTVINLCFKPLMPQSELSSGDFTAPFLSASSSAGGSSGSRRGREAPAGSTGKGHVLPNFLPPQFTAYNPYNPEFCFSVDFLFLANWVPGEGVNTPSSMVEVVSCVVAQHEAKVSPTKPLLGTWY